jgi:hypothetical protein
MGCAAARRLQPLACRASDACAMRLLIGSMPFGLDVCCGAWLVALGEQQTCWIWECHTLFGPVSSSPVPSLLEPVPLPAHQWLAAAAVLVRACYVHAAIGTMLQRCRAAGVSLLPMAYVRAAAAATTRLPHPVAAALAIQADCVFIKTGADRSFSLHEARRMQHAAAGTRHRSWTAAGRNGAVCDVIIPDACGIWLIVRYLLTDAGNSLLQ